MSEKTIFQKSTKGRIGYSFDTNEVDNNLVKDYLPEHLIRKKQALLPELSEFDVIRHFTKLSKQNFSIDANFYPLGSCTMKYNPRVNEKTAALKGFSHTHPMQYQYTVQGNLRLLFELGELLKGLTGMEGVSLQPAAGAHGEFTGLLMMRAYHTAQGNPRKKIIVPDSAHGTNPSSASLCGYKVVTIKTSKEGYMEPSQVESVMDEDVAGLMVTNPSTIGVFEKNIKEVSDIVHKKGGLIYLDGANFNAIMGKVNIADLGIDCMHINLHKTFTTPHGGGGPGAGPVVVSKTLEPYLPIPVIQRDQQGRYQKNYHRENSIGRVRAFMGNFATLVRAYTYIREMGNTGLKQVSEMAVLNANYIRARLKDYYHIPFQAPSLHEVVFSDIKFKEQNVKTLDIAKRLIDFGYHPPTIYFPTIVHGAIMIEPTETENKETLDEFCDAMIKITQEIKETPEILHQAPTTVFKKRLDEVKAVKEPVLKENLGS
ncbi:glycine dehydrogenase (aminomethyl-transferring) [bacterium K02(2017)]|nr:glycine dehydrogenase (aminomethyl-transferring) [bacterium K02(2017)]